MNSDTYRTVEDIRRRRWYPTSTAMGEGGWPAVREFAGNWKTYRLIPPDGEGQTITAEDDAAAWAAYDDVYTVRGRVIEVVTTIREVPPPEEG